MPTNTLFTYKTHPMMIIAGIAVVLFCGVGTAAIMGWIPTSIGSGTDRSVVPKPTPLHHTHISARPSHATAMPPTAVCTNCGVVESVEVITTRARGSGVGAAGGAVIGGLLGNQVGGGRGKDLMTVVGAIGGAVAGNQIEAQVNATHRYDTTIRLEDGSSRTIRQAAQPGWHTGDHVKIVDGVVRANG